MVTDEKGAACQGINSFTPSVAVISSTGNFGWCVISVLLIRKFLLPWFGETSDRIQWSGGDTCEPNHYLDAFFADRRWL